MPDDIKIVLTLSGGLIALGVLCFILATKPINPTIEHDTDDRDPENPEDEARRRQI